MRLRDLMRAFLVMGLLGTMAMTALAAEGDEPTHAAAQPAEDLSEVVKQLQAENPGLTETEALELAGIAATEVELRGPGGREGTALGAPELGGELAGGNVGRGQGQQGMILTPKEQALMREVGGLEKKLADQGLSENEIQKAVEKQYGERFNEMAAEHGFTPGERDDQRLRELYEAGVPGMERAGGLEHRGGGEFGPSERSRGGETERGGFGREQSERFGGEQERGGFSREQSEQSRGEMEREFGGREHGGVEIERSKERSAPEPVERPIAEPIERYAPDPIERPTYEAPTVERPVMEQPTYERPTREHGGTTY